MPANSSPEAEPIGGGLLRTSPLRSVHSTNLPHILRQLGISLVISTYQAGRLVIVRPEPESGLNTHFFGFSRPMGVAADHNRLLVGTQSTIDEFRNVPALCARLQPKGVHDAAYVWRNTHVTASIDIHEMAIGTDGRWYFVNTAFSCLCVMDHEHSFVPVWRPKFVSSYAPEDRCHLNGLGLVDGRPKWLTALGDGDLPQSWRQNKKNGGILIDLQSDEIVCRGLCMPHSPRWYQDRLWLLESGRGALVRIDLGSGEKETITQLPGFTRGLTFAGPLAFIGLSKLRENDAFSNIPITDELNERVCGVWVVNIENGEVIGLLRFEEAVQEIFAVEIIPARFPELVGLDNELLRSTFILPDEALAQARFSGATSGTSAQIKAMGATRPHSASKAAASKRKQRKPH